MRRRVIIFIIVIALVVTIGALWFKREWDDLTYCARPPTQEEQLKQQAFVKANVSDARDFEWSVADCDDRGEAFLVFTTELAAVAVSQAFLADPACSPSDAGKNASEEEVMCTSSAATSYIYEEQREDGQSQMVLAWIPEKP